MTATLRSLVVSVLLSTLVGVAGCGQSGGAVRSSDGVRIARGDGTETATSAPNGPSAQAGTGPASTGRDGSVRGDSSTGSSITAQGHRESVGSVVPVDSRSPTRDARSKTTSDASAGSLEDEMLRDYLRRLKGSADEAAEAYRELWEVRRELIPSLILQVDSRERTRLLSLDLLVLQEDFLKWDAENQVVRLEITGMGKFAATDYAMGEVKGKGKRVRLKNVEGFPLGVVLRAALLNRFRTTRFPGLRDDRDIVRWWQAFYDRVFGSQVRNVRGQAS